MSSDSVRVLILCTSFRSGDGIGNLCRARVKGLLQAGYQVSVLTHEAENWHQGPLCPQIVVVPEGSHPTSSTAAMNLVQNADLVILDFGFHSTLHAFLSGSRAPLIVSYHGLTSLHTINDSMYSAAYWQSIGELNALPQPALVITESTAMHLEYSQVGAYPGVPYRVVSGFGRTSPGRPQAFGASEKLPLKLLCVGRIFPNKNLQVACLALSHLNAEGVDATLDIVGSGGDAIAQRYRESLMKLAEKCPGKIKFRGRVPQEELDELYRDCSAVVIPSLHEGFSLPAVEALMHGKPVFASELAALPETLGNAAIYFNPFSPLDLAEKLKSFQKLSAEQRREVQAKALQRASELSEEAFIRNSLEAIESVIQKDRPKVTQTIPLNSKIIPQPATGSSTFSVDAHWADHVGVTGKIVLQSAPQACGNHRLCVRSLRGPLVESMNHPVHYTTHHEGLIGCLEFTVAASSLTNITSLQLNLLHGDDVDPVIESPAVVIELPVKDKSEGPPCDVAELRSVMRQCLATRTILLPDSAGFLARLRCRIANKFLELVHRSFIAPQTAFLEALISYLEKSRHRD